MRVLFMFMIQSTHLNINGYALLVHMDAVCVENVYVQCVAYVHPMFDFNAMQNTKDSLAHTRAVCVTAFTIRLFAGTPNHLKHNTLATTRFDEPNEMQVL